MNDEQTRRHPPQVVVLQIGARHHYAVPRFLNAAGMLKHFYTDLYSGRYPRLRRVLPALPMLGRHPLVQRWVSRSSADLPTKLLKSLDWLGFRFLIDQRKAGSDRSKLAASVSRHSAAMARALPDRALDGADAVFGFNGTALEMFELAREKGVICLLDQTMAPRRLMAPILTTERERWPGWEAEDGGTGDAPDARMPREEAEWALADRILCPSKFVADGLRELGVDEDRLRLVPYGVEGLAFPWRAREPWDGTRPLRVLFVGQIGLRKGVPYLLEALRSSPPGQVEARIVGPVKANRRVVDGYGDVAKIVGTVPRARMVEEYARADVLVFPSLFEGSATVLYEALSTGLPVICSAASGPPPASSGVTVLPEVSVQAVAEAIERFRAAPRAHMPTREVLPELGLEAYGQRVIYEIESAVAVLETAAG